MRDYRRRQADGRLPPRRLGDRDHRRDETRDRRNRAGWQAGAERVAANEGVSVEDFIRGLLDNVAKGVSLFGGNSMPDDMGASDLAGAQFFNGTPLKGHVVALGVGGPMRTFGNHQNEFQPSEQTVTVTEARDKWIVTLDAKPAMDVYRALRGMKPEDKLTSDWQHPIGVVVRPGNTNINSTLSCPP